MIKVAAQTVPCFRQEAGISQIEKNPRFGGQPIIIISPEEEFVHKRKKLIVVSTEFCSSMHSMREFGLTKHD